MLDEHLFDGLFREIRIYGLTAQRVEIIKGCPKASIRFLFLFDQFFQRSAKLGHLTLKMSDGVGPLFKFRRDVFKEPLKDFHEYDWFGDVLIEGDPAVLPEDCALGRLEDDVILRIAGGELLLYLFAKIVVTVFGFPESMREPELIDERAVHTERMAVVAFDLPF